MDVGLRQALRWMSASTSEEKNWAWCRHRCQRRRVAEKDVRFWEERRNKKAEVGVGLRETSTKVDVGLDVVVLKEKKWRTELDVAVDVEREEKRGKRREMRNIEVSFFGRKRETRRLVTLPKIRPTASVVVGAANRRSPSFLRRERESKKEEERRKQESESGAGT